MSVSKGLECDIHHLMGQDHQEKGSPDAVHLLPVLIDKCGDGVRGDGKGPLRWASRS